MLGEEDVKQLQCQIAVMKPPPADENVEGRRVQLDISMGQTHRGASSLHAPAGFYRGPSEEAYLWGGGRSWPSLGPDRGRQWFCPTTLGLGRHRLAPAAQLAEDPEPLWLKDA